MYYNIALVLVCAYQQQCRCHRNISDEQQHLEQQRHHTHQDIVECYEHSQMGNQLQGTKINE